MTYRVVKIIDEYLLVVNYGLIHNAHKNDILEIYQQGEEIIDPISKDSLGTLDVIKGSIKVINVYEKMSLCKSNEYISVPTVSMQNIGSAIANISRTLSSRAEIKALNVNTKQISGGYSEEKELKININDPVNVIKSNYVDEEIDTEN